MAGLPGERSNNETAGQVKSQNDDMRIAMPKSPSALPSNRRRGGRAKIRKKKRHSSSRKKEILAILPVVSLLLARFHCLDIIVGTTSAEPSAYSVDKSCGASTFGSLGKKESHVDSLTTEY